MGMVKIVEYRFIINITKSQSYEVYYCYMRLKYEVLFGKHHGAHTF